MKFVKRVLENPYSHTHPPYHVGNHGHDLVIMSSPKMLTPNEYDVFFSFLENTVMKRILTVKPLRTFCPERFCVSSIYAEWS